MKALFLSLLCLLGTLGASAHAENEDSAYDRIIAKNEIVCGVFPWEPYKVYNPITKEWSGFGIEIYRRAFATLDLKITFKELVLGNQVQDLNSGLVDAICDDGPWTMSAGKFVEYSNPVYYSIVYPYVRADDQRFKTRADMNAKDIRFTGIDGDLSSDLSQRLFPNATLTSMPAITSVAQLFVNVETGKADVTLCDPAAFSVYEKTNPGKLKPLFSGNPIGKYKAVVSVKKGDFKMWNLVNQAIDNAQTFGIADEVLDGFDPDHKLLMRVRSRAEF